MFRVSDNLGEFIMSMHALKQHKMKKIGLTIGLTAGLCLGAMPAAQADNGRLLATGGVTQIEGSAGLDGPCASSPGRCSSRQGCDGAGR